MFKPILTALMLSLLCGVQGAQSANIPILALPFKITAPGTYVLMGNLTYAVPANVPNNSVPPAILISPSVAGPVILDLKGFTITGTGGYSLGIGIWSIAYPYSNLITVRNGTLNKFGFGVYANVGGERMIGIDINSLRFLLNATGVYFKDVTSSTVRNCTFNGSIYFSRDGSIGGEEGYGIYSEDSQAGSHYTNDTFINIVQPIFESTAVVRDSDGEAEPVVRKLDDCQFAAPIPNETY